MASKSETTEILEKLADIGIFVRSENEDGVTLYGTTPLKMIEFLDMIIGHIDDLPNFKRREVEVLSLREQYREKFGV